MKKENERLQLIIYTCFKNNARNDQWIGGLEQAIHNIASFNAIESEITQAIESETKFARKQMREKRKLDREKRNLQADTIDKVAEQLLEKTKLKEAYFTYENKINRSMTRAPTPFKPTEHGSIIEEHSPKLSGKLEQVFVSLSEALKIPNPASDLQSLFNILERGKDLEMQIEKQKYKLDVLNQTREQLLEQLKLLSQARKDHEDLYYDFLKIQELQTRLKVRNKEMAAAESKFSSAEQTMATLVQYVSETRKLLQIPDPMVTPEGIATRLEEMMSISRSIPRSETMKIKVTVATPVLTATDSSISIPEVGASAVWQRRLSQNVEMLKELVGNYGNIAQ